MHNQLHNTLLWTATSTFRDYRKICYVSCRVWCKSNSWNFL